MRQTLLTIPHWMFEGPLLIAWLVIGLIVLGYLFLRHGNTNETWGFLPVYVIVALVIHFVLPQLEVTGVDPANPGGEPIKLGLSIRGYGIFLLLGISAGVGLTMSRCRYAGLTYDQVLGLGFAMIVTGIIGARIFYIIQKREEFFVEGISLQEMIVSTLDMTKGGLVVLGSLIGGMIGALVYVKMNRLSFARTADVMAPGMAIGLAFGRIGCLMNGCCFGGVCEAPLPAIQFPAGSAPYVHQLYRGELLGLDAKSNVAEDAQFPLKIQSVKDGSIGEALGLEADDSITINFPSDQVIRFQKENGDPVDGDQEFTGYVHSQQKGSLKVPISELPDWSLGAHPTQVYSAINAALLSLVLWFFWTVRGRDGEVFGLMLILYPIARFFLELIRQDELGQFGTSLTISQWGSLGTFLIGIVFFAFIRASGKRVDDSESTSSANPVS